MISFETYRDLTLLDLGQGKRLVISCDSVGGIGEKPEDSVKATPEVVGYYGARVALMEVLSSKAKPLALINTLSVEMKGYGERILKGIEKAVLELPTEMVIPVTGSSEENFPMVQTALGITVIGELEHDVKLPPKTTEEVELYIAGLPKVGEEVLQDEGEILSIKELYLLKKHPSIVDLLPVGSKGISEEIKILEKTHGSFSITNPYHINLKKSGGPSTSVLVVSKKEGVLSLKKSLSAPFIKLS